MVNLNSLMILCLVRFASSEDRISVDTVGTITATAGYSISDNHSPTVTSLQTSSNAEFTAADHDSIKDESSLSDETYTRSPGLRLNSQSLALRSRQARGKANNNHNNNQWQNDGGSVEEKDVAEITTFPFTEHRMNEHLYNVKPQTFAADHQSSSQLSDAKSGESVEKSVPSITYGKKMQENDGRGDGDDRRPVYNDWSEEVRVKHDGEKPSRSRKKNRHQLEAVQEKRRPQINQIASSGEINKDGWQEVSPNMEIATGYSATVQHHDSSQELSGSSESLRTRPIMYHSDSSDSSGSISSIENVAQTEPQNFNHKQVLSKMNHFDFSNAVSPTNKTPPPREKRLNYQPSGNALQQSPPVRFAFGGGAGGLPLKALAPSSAPPPPMTVKSVNAEQPTGNYHSIVVPVPVTHQMYAAIGSGDMVHGHQLASSTMQHAMMSLPVVHNVFFKTDEHGGGKTMPAIVIPLKPEYLQQLQQQQQYLYGMRADAAADSQNAAGHQRPVHVGDAGTKTFHYQQQQQQQQQQQPQPQQKSKPSKAKKPFGPTKDDRVKQPFSLQQHQFYNVPPYGAGHVQQLGQHHHPYHGGGHHAMHATTPQHDPADDSRYGQAAAVAASPAHPFTAVGHSLIVKRPHAYGYAAPAKYKQPVSAEELATVVTQQQQNVKQPYRATTYHPGFAYLNGPDDDYPYRPIYKDTKNRNDVLVVRTDRRK